ncbi:MAG: alpha-N-arabinofuranosidase, partial [Bacteroidales bacterium]|nr:alpha-N-arabinofuranosidase [Bacteroidales bacterium]
NQQNSLRDAFVASLTFDIFHKYADRIQMTNIAQMVNVLQSMILTKDEKMTVTPTYHVFRMYNVHQDATCLPLEIQTKTMDVRDNRTIPLVSATASKNEEGVIHISLSNVHLTDAQEIEISMDDISKGKVSGEILTSESINDHNTFENPNKVEPKTFNGAKFSEGKLTLKIPAKSIVTLTVN